MNNKKKIIISLLGILGLVAIIAGTSVAFFNFSRSGSTENTIDLGSISFHYEEISGKGRGINLIDAFPVESDEDAKNSNDYFDFRITANSNIAEIPYTVAARLSEDTNLDTSIVKIYLTKLEGNSETELLYTTIDQLEEKNFVGSYIDKVLYRTTVPVNGQSYEVNYRLRMWIAEGTDFNTGLYNNKKLSLTVNVYTNDGQPLTNDNVTKIDDTRIKMVSANNTYLLDESSDNDIDYEVNVPNEVNTINFDVTTRNMLATTQVTELGPTLSYNNTGYVRRMSNSNTYNLLVGANYYRVRVTAADGETTENYTLKVNRELSRDNNLTSLSVDGYSFTEPFDEDTTIYHVSNGVELSSITINGNKSSDVATIEGTGTKNLNWGENSFDVTVTPENPNEQPKVYTIVVNNVRPTAPVITGGSDNWISSNAIIALGEPGTAISGISGYEYYITTSSIAPDDNTVATGTLTTIPYSLEVDDIGTNYVYYRTVSNNGNKSVWSTNQKMKKAYTLKDKILSDNSSTKEVIIPDSELKYKSYIEVASNYQTGLFKAVDVDGGYAYYYRGNVTNNYLKIGDDTWRIIKINGDNTIRIIGDTIDYNGTTSFKYSNSSNNASYMYYSNSIVKDVLDNWYQESIENNDNYKNIVTTGTYCQALKFSRANSSAKQEYVPSYSCPMSDGNITNGKLTDQKIGLVTMDEIIMGGIKIGSNSGVTGAPLYVNSWTWTMTPAGYVSDWYASAVWELTPSAASTEYMNPEYISRSLRPVINLKADTMIVIDESTGYYKVVQ